MVRRCNITGTCIINFQTAFLLFVSSILWNCIKGDCPGNVKLEANKCFDIYNTRLLSLQQSDKTLFSGVDVEVIRAFCSSYTTASRCIQNLMVECPTKKATVQQALAVGLEGAEAELKQLCRDDVIYEVYARHQTCYSAVGKHSEKCFERITHTSVQLMRRIDQVPIEILCGNIRELLTCIGTNIEERCGPEAASLVPNLVKPMVRRSTQCDYNVVTSTAKPVSKPTEGGHKNKNDKDNFRNNGTKALGTSVLQILTFMFILLALFKS